MTSALVWFRRDLRLSDNPALHHALAQGYKPVPVYIHDEQSAMPGAASAWWLHHSLAALQKDLQQVGSDLVILKGDSTASLLSIAKDTGARAVFWNRRYEPLAIAQDKQVKSVIHNSGLDTHSFSAALLREPWEFGKADNSPYRVFTPFWKALQKTGPPRLPLAAPEALPPLAKKVRATVTLEALQLLPAINWHSEFDTHWQPGEFAAWSKLHGFLNNGILDYSQDRDRPALQGTSRLSPHLHFGEITPAQIWHFAHAWAANDTTHGVIAAVEAFLRQIAWREFAHHLLFHFPHTADEPLDPRYRAFPWAIDYTAVLASWQKGETGIPIVDAGMRELWSTGWMHNRVRMICASLLTKNLLVPWQQGARWFRDTLVDADLANNSFGWQWTAGCGADAAPYFRIFNPAEQARKFDPELVYVKRWVPEYGKDAYPPPMVDHAFARDRAIEVYRRGMRPD